MLNNPNQISRRSMLYGLGASLGTAALNSLLQAEGPSMSPLTAKSPLSAKPPQIPQRAKRCIFIVLEGGPSHIDTFDPKPRLDKLHMQEFLRDDDFAAGMTNGQRYYVKSPFQFHQVGEAGLTMNTAFKHLPRVADELCIYHGCQAESVNHPTALYHMNTGNRFGGDPSIGAWTTYGLGTENEDLPAFVVMPEDHQPQGGTANWSNGFLPAHYQGTPLSSAGSPLVNLKPPAHVTSDVQRQNLDLLASFNQSHVDEHPFHADMRARMDSYELAFRMQTAVPDVINMQGESRQTLEEYGVGLTANDSFARRCLLSRRMMEAGVRFVQIFSGGWDSHDFLHRAHSARIETVDRSITALISDLKRRGMLDETLIVITGEFGRTPDNGARQGAQVVGRDHNSDAMVVLLAGGGIRAGCRVGATDEIGEKAVETVHPIRDLHVTLLHLLGLDDNKLTYYHAGRFKQLSQFGGKVIPQLIA